MGLVPWCRVKAQWSWYNEGIVTASCDAFVLSLRLATEEYGYGNHQRRFGRTFQQHSEGWENQRPSRLF